MNNVFIDEIADVCANLQKGYVGGVIQVATLILLHKHNILWNHVEERFWNFYKKMLFMQETCPRLWVSGPIQVYAFTENQENLWEATIWYIWG